MIPPEGILLKTKAGSGIPARLMRGCRKTSAPRVQLTAFAPGLGNAGWTSPPPLYVSIDVKKLFKELTDRNLI